MQTQSLEQERKIGELQEEIQTLQNTQASESSASSDLAEVIATVDKLNVEKSQVCMVFLCCMKLTRLNFKKFCHLKNKVWLVNLA